MLRVDELQGFNSEGVREMDLVKVEPWRLRRMALLITAIYILLAICWLCGQWSDMGPLSRGARSEVRFAMDCAFVLITGTVLYSTMYRTMRRIHHSERALRAEQALRQSDEQLKSVVYNSPLAIVTLDADGRVARWNRAAEELYGWSETEAHGLAEPTVPPDKREEARALRTRVLKGERFTDVEVRRIKKDGTPVDVALSAGPLYDEMDRVIGVISFSGDITERKRQAEQVQHLATHDPLTNLPNRRILEEHLGRMVDRAKRGQPSALLMLDLDSFKLVNDGLGHVVGDHFLVNLSRLLETKLRGGDLLTRFGGDEFALLLENTEPRAARIIAERIRSGVAEFRFAHQGQTFDTSVSIGIAPVTKDTDVNSVIVMADRALMIAKEDGRNRVVMYEADSESGTKLAEASKWAARIKEALRDNLFVLHYQPVVRLNDDQPEHYEALIRMKGPDGNLIAPGAFMHAAERFGLMPQIDRWVVENVLTVLTRRPELCVFVNLSGSSLADEELLASIENRLRAFNLGKGRLVFEITETVAVRDLNCAQQWMKRLMDLGCEFALDDFGIAFSSFSYLRALPVSFVKIDGSFIRNLPTDTCNRAMVQALVTVAHALDKKVIAEWVENQSSADVLKEIGAEYGQGYRWGKPQAEAFAATAVA